MIRCCPPRPMRWNAAIGAIARCNATSIACARKCRSVHALRWTCGGKPKPKAVNKPSPHSIMHGLDKPGVFTTVSRNSIYLAYFLPKELENFSSEVCEALNERFDVSVHR